jgi:hypothetical protein
LAPGVAAVVVAGAACAEADCIEGGDTISAIASPAAHNAPVTSFFDSVLFIVLLPSGPDWAISVFGRAFSCPSAT